MLFRISCLAFGISPLLTIASAWGTDNVSGAAQSLAEKVAAIAGIHGSFYLDWENTSSLTEPQSQALRTQFVVQLSTLHIAMSEDASALTLRVRLTETPSKLLFIASLQVAGAEQVRVAEISRSAISPEDLTPVAPRLMKKLLWQQREPILNAAETTVPQGGGNFLLVLGKETLSLYREDDSGEVLRASAQLPAPVHPTRDPLGRVRFLENQPDAFVIELSGHTCRGKVGETLEPQCTAAQAGKGETGNAPGRATIPDDKTATLTSCDHAAWTLSSDGADHTVADHLLLRTAQSAPANVPVSASLDVPGPVDSLSSAADSTSAIAVVFNLLTGNYEVYRVSFSCGN